MPDALQTALIKERQKQLREARLTPIKIDAEIKRKPPAPRALAMRYSAFLGMFQNSVNARVLKALDPLIEAIDNREDASERRDAIDDEIAVLLKSITELIDAFLNTESLLVGITKQGADISAFNTKKYSKPLFRILGFNDLPAGRERTVLNSWVRNNLRLIKGVNEAQVNRLESLMYQSAQTGARAKGIRSEITRTMKSSTSRAKLIARDQTLKLSGQLDQVKQTNAGVTHYFWRTSLDGNRVRPAHRDREGKRFAWNDPPPDGHPGQPVQCRCTAEPDLRHLIGDLS